MQVKALERGYHGVLREEGEIFSIPDGEKPGSWMEPVEEESRKPEREAAEVEPVALSEVENVEEPTPKKRGRPRKTD